MLLDGKMVDHAFLNSDYKILLVTVAYLRELT